MNRDTRNSEPSPSVRRGWLAALLLRRPEGFLSRFAAGAARWRALPRYYRRRLARRTAATAAGAALILAMAGSPLLVPTARAATITVDGATCTLDDAIRAANTDSVSGFCASGTPGLDTIDLQADVLLTAYIGDYYGETGLPAVTSEIVIEGNGFTIERDGAAPEFRILYVDATGDLTLNNVTISGGNLGSSLENGGGILVSDGKLKVYDSAITGNEAGNYGGGIANYGGDVTIGRSYFYGNSVGDEGGGVAQYFGTMTILDSTFTGNEAGDDGGAIVNYYGEMTIVNSTFSGNSAITGGAIYNSAEMTIVNSTLTDNTASVSGGGIFSDDPLTLSRNIVSGNTADVFANEIDNRWTINADDYNVFSHAGQTSADALDSFTPGASDIDASSDTANVPLTDILDTTLADNGGPALTHDLVADSPAVDLAPDADCIAPSLTDGVDQRGAPRPFDVVGQGNEVTDTCDAGAVEFGSPVPGDAIFMSTTVAGTTDDNVAFGGEDILMWDGEEWSLRFDGSAAGLTPNGKAKHNINAFYVDPDGPFTLMSFTQNARTVPGIFGKVDGMDLVVWDGSQFILVFDGQDVGLTNKTAEKIDGVHLLPGSASPIGVGCQVYLLISTQGPGKVPNYSGGTLNFSGEDVLGFCVTSNGDNTTGLWHMVLDGSAEGMPKNSTGDFSLSDDGQTLYLTTKGTFNVDSAVGGHSMVYTYDMVIEDFDGPFFIAAQNGLEQKVDGLQVEGMLP